MGPLAPILIPAAASFLSSMFGAKMNADANEREGRLTREQQLKLAQLADQRDRDLNAQDVAAKEATTDPWGQTMAQAKDLSFLDVLERASTSPVRLNLGADNPYAKWVPQRSGGFNYSASPELIAMAAAAKKAVAAGKGRTPTMTDPSNYGKTGGLDFSSLLDGTGMDASELEVPTNSALSQARAGVRRDPWARRNYDR